MGVIHTGHRMVRKGGWYNRRPSHGNDILYFMVLIIGMGIGLIIRCIQYA